jgi:hypothetical protein
MVKVSTKCIEKYRMDADRFVIGLTSVHMMTHNFHSRYYNYIGQHCILKKGREVVLTGCCLRTAVEGSGRARILPTEYMVILLDEVTIQSL